MPSLDLRDRGLDAARAGIGRRPHGEDLLCYENDTLAHGISNEGSLVAIVPLRVQGGAAEEARSIELLRWTHYGTELGCRRPRGAGLWAQTWRVLLLAMRDERRRGSRELRSTASIGYP